ncbi:PAS domain-containing protein [Methanolobus sp. ZRKC2]|uniref:PAS domain-containing protein n=1 Tax=Methanolobus sp. ZRKC2 TaxID=3125783 RepID=UPI003246AA68
MAVSMDIYTTQLKKVKKLLQANPRGMSVTDIAKEMKLSRNTTAKYLEMLRISGCADMESIGTAKVYYLSHRIPVSTLLNFSSECILVVDSYLSIIQINKKFLSLLGLVKDNVVGKKADSLLSPMFPEINIAAKLNEAINGKEHKETMHFLNDEKDCFFYTKIVPSTFDEGEQGATLILENITDRVYKHNSLLEHRDRLEMLVQERTKELEETNRLLKKEIAEKKKAEKLLKESEERYKKLYMESTPWTSVHDKKRDHSGGE